MGPGSTSDAIAAARAAFPDVEVADDVVRAHIESKLAGGVSLTALRTNELFLAAACAAGSATAIARFETAVAGEIEAVHRRVPNAAVDLDDTRQRLREKLFFATPPAVMLYAGTGALGAWVRAVALNLLLNIAQRETREAPTDDALFDVVLGSEPTAEAMFVKLSCRAELSAAIAAAMAALDARDRGLLRHAFVDRRSVDAIGALYGVHRATAARWVAAARERLIDKTLEDLTSRLGISETEARSIVAAGMSGVGSILLAKLRETR